MKIELTPDQQEQIERAGGQQVSVHDPKRGADYVLVPTDQYEQMVEMNDDDIEQRALRRAAARTLTKRLADDGA